MILRFSFFSKYDQKIGPNVLPINLEEITFGSYYNQKIDVGVLPDNLKIIKFNFKPEFRSRFEFQSETEIKLNYESFSCNTKVYIGRDDITSYIHILKSIDDLLPMPIAEEIIPYIYNKYNKYVECKNITIQ